MTGWKDRFDFYYDKYREFVTKSLMKITEANEALTDDLSQEVWIAFYLEMDKVTEYEEEGIRGWLYAVAKHRFLDFIKQSYESQKADEEEIERYGQLGWRIEEGVITRLMFEDYVAGLSEEDRALVLCKICGISPRDALPDMECTDNALNVRATRALRKLKRYLEQE